MGLVLFLTISCYYFCARFVPFSRAARRLPLSLTFSSLFSICRTDPDPGFRPPLTEGVYCDCHRCDRPALGREADAPGNAPWICDTCVRCQACSGCSHHHTWHECTAIFNDWLDAQCDYQDPVLSPTQSWPISRLANSILLMIPQHSIQGFRLPWPSPAYTSVTPVACSTLLTTNWRRTSFRSRTSVRSAMRPFRDQPSLRPTRLRTRLLMLTEASSPLLRRARGWRSLLTCLGVYEPLLPTFMFAVLFILHCACSYTVLIFGMQPPSSIGLAVKSEP